MPSTLRPSILSKFLKRDSRSPLIFDGALGFRGLLHRLGVVGFALSEVRLRCWTTHSASSIVASCRACLFAGWMGAVFATRLAAAAHMHDDY